MTPYELRIGNRLKQGIVKSLYYNGYVGFDTGNSQSLELIDGIPLTSEWLWKAGLYRAGDRYKLGNFQFWFENGEGWAATHLHEVRIKYVHQLQNLYYALTGQELTFN